MKAEAQMLKRHPHMLLASLEHEPPHGYLAGP